MVPVTGHALTSHWEHAEYFVTVRQLHPIGSGLSRVECRHLLCIGRIRRTPRAGRDATGQSNYHTDNRCDQDALHSRALPRSVMFTCFGR